MSEAKRHRYAGPRRHRRAWRPWHPARRGWDASVVAGIDSELGVIADRRRSEARDLPSVP